MHMPFDKLGQHRGRSYREKRRGFLGTRMVSYDLSLVLEGVVIG